MGKGSSKLLGRGGGPGGGAGGGGPTTGSGATTGGDGSTTDDGGGNGTTTGNNANGRPDFGNKVYKTTSIFLGPWPAIVACYAF
jgi:hypothetical protein